MNTICSFISSGVWPFAGVLTIFTVSLASRLLRSRAYEDYVRLYREHRRVALSLPGEPYDFGRNSQRLWQIMWEQQEEPVLESARQRAISKERYFWVVLVCLACTGGAFILIVILSC